MICAWIETSRAETGSSHTMNFGSTAKRARDADALALSARKLVRVPVDVIGAQSDAFEQVLHALLHVFSLGDPVNSNRLRR